MSRRQGGFYFEADRLALEALWESGWRVGPGFQAGCTDCDGTGNDLGGQCRCAGLLWFPPEVIPVAK